MPCKPANRDRLTFSSGESWPVARAAEAPGWLVTWVVKSAGRRYEERKAAAGLLSMGDRLLRDIGVSRADAEELIRG